PYPAVKEPVASIHVHAAKCPRTQRNSRSSIASPQSDNSIKLKSALSCLACSTGTAVESSRGRRASAWTLDGGRQAWRSRVAIFLSIQCPIHPQRVGLGK